MIIHFFPEELRKVTIAISRYVSGRLPHSVYYPEGYASIRRNSGVF